MDVTRILRLFLVVAAVSLARGASGAASLALPPVFLENQGQWPEEVRFVAMQGGATTFVTTTGLRVVLGGTTALFVTFEGADALTRVVGEDCQSGRYHFFLGRDPDRWRRDVSGFAAVRYHEVQAGMDVLVRLTPDGVEYDLELRPGWRGEDVRVRIEGQEQLSLERDGCVALSTVAGWARQSPPSTYQTLPNGERRPLPLDVAIERPGTVRFRIGAREPDATVVVDPALMWSTFVTSFGACGTVARADGTLHFGGNTSAADFPTTPGAYQTNMPSQSQYAFVARITNDGKAVVFGTYVGAAGGLSVTSFSADEAGASYVAGGTGDPNYPVTPQAFDKQLDGFGDGFAFKLSPDGSGLVYSTYLGGNGGNDTAFAGTVDATGRYYLTGRTYSTDFPVTPNAFQAALASGYAGYVAVFDPMGALVYGSYLGGTNPSTTIGFGIDVDSTGSIHVSGAFAGLGFPTTPGAFDTTWDLQRDVFVTKFDPSWSSLAYSTFLGSNGDEAPYDSVLDAQARLCIVGEEDGGFPTTPTNYNPTPSYGIEAFVTKLSSDGSSLVFSGILGGGATDRAKGVALDAAGSVLVTGYTHSSSQTAKFPTTPGAFQGKMKTAPDAFLSKIDPSGTTLLYSTLLGGDSYEYGDEVAVGPGGVVYALGQSYSTDFPLTPGTIDTQAEFHNGYVTAFNLCGGKFQAHGTGCAGGAGVPVLSGSGCPAPGEAVVVALDIAAQSAPALLLFGLGTQTIPLTPNCGLAIGPIAPLAYALTTSPAGTLVIPGVIPAMVPAASVQIQILVADPQGLAGVAASNALRIDIQY